jgi:hypothetical protein
MLMDWLRGKLIPKPTGPCSQIEEGGPATPTFKSWNMGICWAKICCRQKVVMILALKQVEA